MNDSDKKVALIVVAMIVVLLLCGLCSLCSMTGISVFLINQLERGRPVYDDYPIYNDYIDESRITPEY